LEQDELIDYWTLVGDELDLVAGKRGATKLGFALLLRFYAERGRFPRGAGEIPDAAVDYVARQVAVGATEIGARAEVRVTNQLIKEFKRVTGKDCRTRRPDRSNVPSRTNCPLIPPVRSAGLQVGERCEDSAVVIAGLKEA
jgi:hypothetical protein